MIRDVLGEREDWDEHSSYFEVKKMSILKKYSNVYARKKGVYVDASYSVIRHYVIPSVTWPTNALPNFTSKRFLSHCTLL